MGRGFGRVQWGCLTAIWEYEQRGEWPTTFDIVEHVYRLKPGARKNLEITDAQHVAVKRALEGLQRKGRVIGFRTRIGRNPDDGRAELCHHWMTEKGLMRWLTRRREWIQAVRAMGGHPEKSVMMREMLRVLAKAKAIGMDIEREQTGTETVKPDKSPVSKPLPILEKKP